MLRRLMLKVRHKRRKRRQLVAEQNTNWLFVCCICGKPITFDEPLVTWTHNNAVQVAHPRCSTRAAHEPNE